MEQKELKIAGMNCGHCIMSVRKELEKIPNVKVEDVQIGNARVQYDAATVTTADFARAVEEAGYQLIIQ